MDHGHGSHTHWLFHAALLQNPTCQKQHLPAATSEQIANSQKNHFIDGPTCHPSNTIPPFTIAQVYS